MPMCQHIASYSQTTLLIEGETYPQALEQARELQSQLDSSQAPCDCHLRPYNLLRIALLETEIGDQETQHVAWSDLMAALSSSEKFPGFHTDTVSLLDFAKAQLYSQAVDPS